MATLEIKNIEVSAEGKTVVKDVSLSLASGEAHIIMGRNGSGKSSLLNAIMGHPGYSVKRGTITLDGDDILTLPTEEKARRGIFLSLQHAPEIDGVGVAHFLHTTYEAFTGTKVPAMEFHRGLKEKAVQFGAEGLLAREVNVGFSGGEKKLLEALLLSLVMPKFAFLDEIDSGWILMRRSVFLRLCVFFGAEKRPVSCLFLIPCIFSIISIPIGCMSWPEEK